MRDLRQDTGADETGLRGQVRDQPVPGRWPVNLDVFWPILAVILVVAVIFVASVAHSSMNKVGVLVVQSAAVQPPTPSPVPTEQIMTGPIMIVQVSSHTTRTAAQAACEELLANGYRAKVLDSDNYRPLNRGYYVVYVGPYPETSAGRAAANRVQAKISGSLVRQDLRAR